MIAETPYILLKWTLHQRIGFGPPHISWLYIRINDTYIEEVCVFVRKGAYFTKTVTLYHCKKRDLGVCAIKLETRTYILIVLSLYGAPEAEI